MISSGDFKPAWWLPGAHLQTIFSPLFRETPKLNRQKITLTLPDGDHINNYWTFPSTVVDTEIKNKKTNNTPIVILLHGLAGSADSIYIMALQERLKEKYITVAMQCRSAGGEANALPRSYHASDIDDIHALYLDLKNQYPDAPISAIGYSLGGNMILNWLGRYHDKIHLCCAAAVSVPFDLARGAVRLDTGLSKVYRNRLMEELLASYRQKLSLFKNQNKTELAKQLEVLGDLHSTRSFYDYDNDIVAPLHGFADASTYYEESGCKPYLKNIDTQTLIIHSKDDPFMYYDVAPTSKELSATIQLELSKKGGHVGFVASKGLFKAEYWLDKRLATFIDSMHPSRSC